MKVHNLVFSEKKQSIPLQKEDVFLATAGFSCGMLAFSNTALSFILIVCSSLYHRDHYRVILIGAFYLMGTLVQSFWHFYFNAVLLCIFALLIAFIKLLKGNLLVYFPVISAFVALLGTLVLEQKLDAAFWSMLITGALCYKSLQSMPYSAKKFGLSPLCFGALILSFYGAAALAPGQTTVFIAILFYCFLALLIDVEELILLLLCSLPVFLSGSLIIPWGVSFLMAASLKECGIGAQLFGFALPAVLAFQQIEVLTAAIVVFFLALLLSRVPPVKQIMAREASAEKSTLLKEHQLLEHQLMQFTRIFEGIASFFEPSHTAEMSFVWGMAKAMEQLAYQLKETGSLNQDEAEKIQEILKGYHYHVKKAEVKQTAQGQKFAALVLEECSRREAEEVILPLLQMTIDRNLRLINYHSNRLFKNGVKIELCGSKPLLLKVQAFSTSYEKEACGDTWSRFEFQHHVLCTISDGMGTGNAASRSSRFVTELIQRLLAAGIPAEMAVKSMNSLLAAEERESFATLDVLIFDELAHQAYLAKSGACATLLLRKGQVLKITSKSLPLGIVKEIEADCYQLDCQSEDLFVLFSDGISEEKMIDWLLTADRKNIYEEIAARLEKLNVNDDTTVLLAEVKKS